EILRGVELEYRKVEARITPFHTRLELPFVREPNADDVCAGHDVGVGDHVPRRVDDEAGALALAQDLRLATALPFRATGHRVSLSKGIQRPLETGLRHVHELLDGDVHHYGPHARDERRDVERAGCDRRFFE